MLKTSQQTRITQSLPPHLFPPSDFLSQHWPHLQHFLDILFQRPLNHPLPFINLQLLYKKVEDIDKNHQERGLFDHLCLYLDGFLSNSLEKIESNPDFLQNLSLFWDHLVVGNSQILSGVFRHFESVYLKPTLRLKGFETLIHSRLCLLLEGKPGLRLRFIKAFLELIHLERAGEPFPSEVLRSCWELAQKVSAELYVEFEGTFLEESRQFYQKAAEKHVKGMEFSIEVFVRFVENRFELEARKFPFFRNSSTEASLSKVLDTELIEKNMDNLLDIAALGKLVEKKDIETLERIYRQVSRINRQDTLRKAWLTTLKELSRNLLAGSKETVLIESILALRKDAIHLVKEAFQGNKNMRNVVDLAISSSLDSNPNKTAELASKEFDLKLRKRGKAGGGLGNEEVTRKELDELFEVFRYITSKDMFEEFYTRRLVKRLLFGGVSSHELELHVLEKLKNECGVGYIKKAEEIFKDVEISKQINIEFTAKVPRNLDFYVTVLHSNSWPLANAALPGLIEPFESLKNAFAEFYVLRQPGALLSWQFEGSSCELYGYFKGEKYLLNVSILQAMILLLFNSPISSPNKKCLTFSAIHNLLPFDPEELKKGLFSLFFMKEKVLLKSGNDQKTLTPQDEFRINEGYQSKAKIVKINSVSKKETANEIKETEEKVLHERQYVIDAAIVRIMKSKKTIGHNELINEVFNDLKLPITGLDAKKRIESLIGRDYLKRDSNNPQIYHYVA